MTSSTGSQPVKKLEIRAGSDPESGPWPAPGGLPASTAGGSGGSLVQWEGPCGPDSPVLQVPTLHLS